jgi:hypothetical protein
MDHWRQCIELFRQGADRDEFGETWQISKEVSTVVKSFCVVFEKGL